MSVNKAADRLSGPEVPATIGELIYAVETGTKQSFDRLELRRVGAGELIQAAVLGTIGILSAMSDADLVATVRRLDAQLQRPARRGAAALDPSKRLDKGKGGA